MNAVNNEVEVIKQAAYRLQEFLATKNIRVQHTVALEALSASLGSRNWRTLRDKLSEPSAAAPTLESLKGLRWSVSAVYWDGSEYSTFVAGETLQEAAIAVLYERLASRDQVRIVAVEDRLSGETHPLYLLDCQQLLEHGALFRDMLTLARRLLGSRAEVQVKDLPDWRARNLALEFLEGLLKSDKLCEQLTEFTARMPETRYGGESSIGFAASDDLFMTFQVSQVLWEIATIVREKDAELVDLEREKLYQYEALLNTFEDKVARIIVHHAMTE